jgi:hypothetical protein
MFPLLFTTAFAKEAALLLAVMPDKWFSTQATAMHFVIFELTLVDFYIFPSINTLAGHNAHVKCALIPVASFFPLECAVAVHDIILKGTLTSITIGPCKFTLFTELAEIYSNYFIFEL